MDDLATWPILICVLGDFCLLKAGQPLDLCSGTMAEAFLCALALGQGHGVARDVLLATLWPEREVELAGHSLHSLVYKLHTLLGDALGGAAPVLHAKGYYRLNSAAGVAVDVSCFEALAETGDRQRRAGDHLAAVASYRQAVRLYRGDLCLGTDSQACVARENLRVRYCDLLIALATHSYEAGDYATCLEYAGRLLASDPCREDGHRLLMRCHVRRGVRADALRQYRLCVRLLHEEFNVMPEPATTALFEQVCRDPGSI